MMMVRIAGRLLLGALFMAATAAGAAKIDTPNSLEGVTVVDAAKVQELMRAGVVVYDVRVAAEYAEKHIKGAKNLPYREKSAKKADFDKSQDRFALDRLPADKNAALVVYCNSGDCWKSYKAAKLAVEAGHKQVYWFRGGFPEWNGKGLPVE
jgi:rhodanese-related sulfurtransferase